jgi:hypothetical protein
MSNEALVKQEQGEPVVENICNICGYRGVETDTLGQCPKCRWDELVPVDDGSLRSALNAMLTQFGMDEDEWNKPTFDQARKALANQEQGEPVGVVTGVYGGRFTYAPFKSSVILPVGMALYSSPQQRTWVGLTDDDLRGLGFSARPHWWPLIEAKLKEKNT